jgi:hypothetical protein
MAAAQSASPIHSFYSKFLKAKSGSGKASSTITKAARDHLSSLIALYNVDLTSKFGVADFDPTGYLKGKQVEAAEYISAQFMAIATYVMTLAGANNTDFEALLEVGIPQLIAYQLQAGALCHNKVAKQMNEGLGRIDLA